MKWRSQIPSRRMSRENGGRQAHSNVVRSHAREMARNPSDPILPHCDTLNTKYELNDM